MIRQELYRSLIEHSGPEAEAVRALLARDEEQRYAKAAAKRYEGGLTALAVGIASGAFFYFEAPKSGLYVLALIPILVGPVLVFRHGGGNPARRNERA